jgi:hypothetical protein
MWNHECIEARTNESYPGHEFIGGQRTRCGETDPQMDESEQEQLANLYQDTLDGGGYEREGMPVPFS